MKRKTHCILIVALLWAFIPAAPARAEALYVQRTGSANPLNVNLGLDSYGAPAFADLDYDGDLDAFIGVVGGTIRYFRNTGTKYSPSFSEYTGANNPLNVVSVGANSAPTFVDLDHDGDLDAFVGESDGTINFFYNIGNIVTPNFSPLTGSSNPFDGESVGANSKPTFFDYDHDGDMDAFVGSSDGKIYWFRNDGSAVIWNFTAITLALADTYGTTIDAGANSAPAFMDLDGDGDMDLAIGSGDGTIKYYENNGDAEFLDLEERSATDNPFASVAVWLYSTPALVDIDHDGDLDAFFGEKSNGQIRFYENIGDNTEIPSMQEQTGQNPLSNKDVGTNSAPTFVDIDADGDMDAFSGATDGAIHYYKNTGHATNPTFITQAGTDNPFNGVDVGAVSHPAFVDADGDGDLDAVIGASDGKLYYFENAGDAVSPNFIERTGSLNPFNNFNASENENRSAPAFANYIDGYKGLEAFVGFEDGGIRSFANTLFPFPSYASYWDPPLTSIDVGYNSSPAFCDLHSDGQVDSYIGETAGAIVYYTGFGDSSGYNPFASVDVGVNATPAFVDIDADGDYDAFVGELDGVFTFFENFS
ncbi:MAG: VCBS repeat-containing protein, partial [Anaerolineales bacterium]|nr:VCBS repeat-containing protein [Anaerolineales bacterium]